MMQNLYTVVYSLAAMPDLACLAHVEAESRQVAIGTALREAHTARIEAAGFTLESYPYCGDLYHLLAVFDGHLSESLK